MCILEDRSPHLHPKNSALITLHENNQNLQFSTGTLKRNMDARATTEAHTPVVGDNGVLQVVKQCRNGIS